MAEEDLDEENPSCMLLDNFNPIIPKTTNQAVNNMYIYIYCSLGVNIYLFNVDSTTFDQFGLVNR